ncbi:MAG TPA: hypothetical protein VD996_05045 [Chitinophagaceae bacterium]|nr:hypothetical protein [Chitinophagaceae bacterium]
MDRESRESRGSREPKESNDQDFPGYPHYPSKEDIMSPNSEMERVQVDVENLTPSGKYVNTMKEDLSTGGNQPVGADATATPDDDDLSIVPGTEADVTRDDLLALGGSRPSENDLHGVRTTTVSGDDLDVPGAELDNPNEEIGEEDEENNYYSLGGDRHENLEEDPQNG